MASNIQCYSMVPGLPPHLTTILLDRICLQQAFLYLNIQRSHNSFRNPKNKFKKKTVYLSYTEGFKCIVAIPDRSLVVIVKSLTAFLNAPDGLHKPKRFICYNIRSITATLPRSGSKGYTKYCNVVR